jgi:HSP20 family protein
MAQAMTPLRQSILAPRYGDPFQALRAEMDQLFDNFFQGAFAAPAYIEGRHETLVPSLDMRETDTSIIIEAELPGLDIKDVELTVENGVLSISGEKKTEKREEKENFHLMERRYGRFERHMRLPETVDENKVEARFEKGVLRVNLPKKPEAVKQHKKIAIKAG